MSIKQYKAEDWVVYWAGAWSLLSDSYFGKQYMKRPFLSKISEFVQQVIFMYRGGLTTTYVRELHRKKFAEDVRKLIQSGDFSVEKICNSLKRETDAFLSIINRDEGKEVSLGQFQEYIDALFSYYPAHIEVKNIVDALNDKEREKYMADFEEARVYAEPVFSRSEEYMVKLAKVIGDKVGYKKEWILAMLSEEFEEYLSSGRLPQKELLGQRHGRCALAFDKGLREIFLGEEADALEKQLLGTMDVNEIQGQIAYKGKAKGKVRIVFNPNFIDNFNEGDILVAEMTRPEFLPLMKKASAFVTDGGGVLCHAAIVAREMKKPCIIGTRIATKVLKDGDLVEVDANKGVVRKI